MPVYNAAPFLAECLDSILQQTETNWELIAVDDFSTDESAAILRAYQNQDKRIQYQTNTEKGIIPALRKAYTSAQGAFITRMDADDIMPPQKLKHLKTVLLQNGPGHLATGQIRYFSAHQLGDGYLRYEHWLNELMQEGVVFSDRFKECVIPSPCWMVHRADFDACGGFHSSRYPEDYDLCLRFYYHGLKACPSPEVLHLWRDHGQRATRNDPNYLEPHFFTLKMHYFLHEECPPDQPYPIILWGAGKKGKKIAQILAAAHRSFQWVSENPKKIGVNIYGTTLQSTDVIEKTTHPRIIIAVSNPAEQLKIEARLKKWHLTKGVDYFFFC